MSSMVIETSPPPARLPLAMSVWAPPVDRLSVEAAPASAINANVDGRQLTGALQGFGPLWRKTYRVRLSGVDTTPAELIEVWKERFPTFWPTTGRFYAPLTSISPGEVALINIVGPAGMPLSTGVMVIYADETSFTFMNPEGHMFAGWITFSASVEDGETVAQVEALIRTSDPVWEALARVFMFAKEDAFWRATLRSLAAHFGAEASVQESAVCLDRRVQWAQVRNIWRNAGMWTMLHLALTPLRRARRRRAAKTSTEY